MYYMLESIIYYWSFEFDNSLKDNPALRRYVPLKDECLDIYHLLSANDKVMICVQQK